MYGWKAHIKEILKSSNKKWLPHLLSVWPRNCSISQNPAETIVREAVSAILKAFEPSVISMLLYIYK